MGFLPPISTFMAGMRGEQAADQMNAAWPLDARAPPVTMGTLLLNIPMGGT